MIVIASKSGQLGNRLFLFGHFIACAAENGLTIYNPSFDEYGQFFVSTRRNPFCRYPSGAFNIPVTGKVRRVSFLVAYAFLNGLIKTRTRTRLLTSLALPAERMFSLDDPQDVEGFRRHAITAVSGWLFRGESNFLKHADVIRAYFTPLEDHVRNIRVLIEGARKSCDVLVGIHIRRGDYKTHEGGRYYYPIDDYIEIMRRIMTLFEGKRVGYLVCSNEHLDPAQFNKFNVTFGNNHVLEDMYAFARCDYIAGPPSTYTMWASFYGQTPLYVVDDVQNIISLDQFKCVLS